MELFDKKFVRFMWDDELEGKMCFVSDGVDMLKAYVEKDESSMRLKITKGIENRPFKVDWTDAGLCDTYQFAYYDPNYEVKKAFNEGKKVQVKKIDSMADWTDCEEPLWSKDCSYRIKPEEEKWVAYLARDEEKPYLTSCREGVWEIVQEDYGAKVKLFVGFHAEVREWYESRRKFAEVIKAWEDGKTIQFLSRQQQLTGEWIDVWYDCIGPDEPKFLETVEYRVKPEEEKSKRMTYLQLAEWLAKGNGQFTPLLNKSFVSSTMDYDNALDDKELPEGYKIRCWGSDEWVEPLFDCYTYLDGTPWGMEQ